MISTPVPGGSDGKDSACIVGDSGSIPGLGGSPGEGHGNPLQYSCLENPMDREAWWAAVYGVAKSWTCLKQLSTTQHRNLNNFPRVSLNKARDTGSNQGSLGWVVMTALWVSIFKSMVCVCVFKREELNDLLFFFPKTSFSQWGKERCPWTIKQKGALHLPKWKPRVSGVLGTVLFIWKVRYFFKKVHILFNGEKRFLLCKL